MFGHKKQPKLTVTIPEPCHENWQAMLPAERGRYCQACQIVVTDFSALTDDELIKHIEQLAGKKTCGRFADHQLNRALVAAPKIERVNPLKKIAASIILLYAAFNKVAAQMPVVQHPVYVTQHNGSKEAVKDSDIVISGKVIDFTGKGLAGLELRIKGMDVFTVTNTSGHFKFNLPDSCFGKKLIITTSINGAKLLDANGAMINDTTVEVNAQSFSKEVIITTYVVQVIPEVKVDVYQAKGLVTIGNYRPSPEAIDDSVKISGWDKIRQLAKPKK